MRYYSTQRPVVPGGYPKPQDNRVLNIENFDYREYIESIDRRAWGFIEYEHPLTEAQAASYELVAEPEGPAASAQAVDDDFPELSMYDENGTLTLYRDDPALEAGTYRVVFQAGGLHYYCNLEGCDSLLEALGLFFKDHPNVTYSMVVSHEEI